MYFTCCVPVAQRELPWRSISYGKCFTGFLSHRAWRCDAVLAEFWDWPVPSARHFVPGILATAWITRCVRRRNILPCNSGNDMDTPGEIQGSVARNFPNVRDKMHAHFLKVTGPTWLHWQEFELWSCQKERQQTHLLQQTLPMDHAIVTAHHDVLQFNHKIFLLEM